MENMDVWSWITIAIRGLRFELLSGFGNQDYRLKLGDIGKRMAEATKNEDLIEAVKCVKEYYVITSQEVK